jgi:glycosyltransferase involved in cell wall biosynthesis
MDFTRSLFSSNDVTGCGYIRSFLPARHLNGQFMGGFNRNICVDHLDNIFFQRHTHKDFLEIIPNLQRIGRKVYYDLDDDLWTLDDKNPAKGAFPPETIEMIERLISLSDGVYTSTEYLKSKLLKHHSIVNVVPNLVEPPRHPKGEKKKIRVGYAGSLSHAGDFSKTLIYALQKLWNKYKSKIELVFVGYIPPELKEYTSYVAGIDAPNYLNLLNHINLDIFIIPLTDTEFNKSKSNLKWLDAGICGACPVLSNVTCYGEVVDNETGVLIKKNEWFDVLEHLINTPEEVQRISSNAYDHVLNEYSWTHAAHKQMDVYKTTLRGKHND